MIAKRSGAGCLLLVALACPACDDVDHEAPLEPPPPGRDAFEPIGRFTDAGHAQFVDAEPPPERPSPEPDAGPAPDMGPPPPLQLEFVAIEQDSGAHRATDLRFLPDAPDQFLLLDQDGEVIHMRLEGDRARRLGGFTIDDLWRETDAGLLSVAFDPDFADNRFFYLGLTTAIESSVVRRYTWDPADMAATEASAVDVVEVVGAGTRRDWHNVGSIGFTEEGHLWALFGDKTLSRFAGDPMSPLGGLLRIVPDHDEDGGYTVPADNPWADGSGHPALYALGMRSPWKGVYWGGRWIFGDVGLDTYEEINVIDGPGLHFGWPRAEGPCEEDCEGLSEPWFAWSRSSSDPLVAENPRATSSGLRSAWVGLVYQPNGNDRYRGRFDDVLTFGDAYVGSVRAVRADGEGPAWNAGHLRMATGWAQGPDGYVYVTTLGTKPRDPPETPAMLYRAVLAE